MDVFHFLLTNMKSKKIGLIILLSFAGLIVIFLGHIFLVEGRKWGQKIEQTENFKYALREKLNQAFRETGSYPERISDILNEIPLRDFTVRLESYDCDKKSYKVVVVLCFYESMYMKIEEKASDGEIVYSKWGPLDSNSVAP
jgi:hypothetical protein